MQDVARAAGVHQTTVSRALRNDPRIPDATRRRIQRIAERMEYRPNPLVSALIAVRRSRHPPSFPIALAFVVHSGGPDNRYLPHQYTYEAHLAGARRAAEELGYRVELFLLDASGVTARRVDQILRTRNIPGVIIGSLPGAHGSFSLSWERLCAVVIEYTFTEPALDRVVHDSYDGMRRIMAKCRERGFRRVGLTLTEAGHERTEYLNGAAYWMEQKADGFFTEIPPLFTAAWDAAAFLSWRRRHRPEVIVTSNALLPDLTGWCRENALRPGRDLRIANVNAAADGDVSGVYQDPVALGATAARVVIEKIGRNVRGVPPLRETILTAGRWIEGSSLRPKSVARLGPAA